ncbi:MAG: hypothetical protein HQL41_09310 [Alphaproteobacteria bacterium]|nr:hypothetical protein [Alphaproteobacteria bacterium]
MRDEMEALVASIAKALEMPDADAAKAIEDGRVALEMLSDENGRNYVRVTHQGKSARIYQGAILHGD